MDQQTGVIHKMQEDYIAYSRYLNVNPIDWLLEDSDPCVRYRTITELLDREPSHTDYSRLLSAPQVRRLLNTENNGVLGDTVRFDLFYRGAMWCLAEAAELGLDRKTGVVENTARLVLDRYQLPSGGFTLNWKPLCEDACRTGFIMQALIRTGISDERIDRGIEWILRHQRHDGGWLHSPVLGGLDTLGLVLFKRAGRGLSAENDSSVKSGFEATAACAGALAEYCRHKSHGPAEDALAGAAEFLLSAKLFTRGAPENTAGFAGNGCSSLGYPVLSGYTILQGLYIAARAGLFHDPRTGEAFNIVMSKQDQDGTWKLEQARTGMLYGNFRKPPLGEKNRWITFSVLKILKNAGHC